MRGLSRAAAILAQLFELVLYILGAGVVVLITMLIVGLEEIAAIFFGK